MPEPIDKNLYEYVKSLADNKFESKSGIYRSSWIVKEYIRRGGLYYNNKPKLSGLKRWFKEKWVDLNRPIKNKSGKIIGYHECGRESNEKNIEKYPLCRPSRKISSKTPRTYQELSKVSIEKAKREKRRVKGSKNIQFGGNTSKALEVGDQININNDVYEIIKELGSGSFKTALMAQNIQEPLQKIVVFELFIQPLLTKEDKKLQKILIQNFIEEIWVLNKIKEVNKRYKNIICPIFTQEPIMKDKKVIQHGYIITNYFSGDDLFTFLFEKDELKTDYLSNNQDIPYRTLKILESIVEAFDIFHNKLNFAHLDIKPENIMIDENDNISIIDVGRSCNVIDIECIPGGTEAYIAPEIFLATSKIKDFNMVKKADIWSLGCVLYDIVFQKYTIGDIIDLHNKNFTEKTIKESIYSLIQHPQMKPNLVKIAKIIVKMLNYDYNKRPDISYVLENIQDIMLPSIGDLNINHEGGKPQFYGKKSDIMVKVPKNVKKWAEYAFVLKQVGFKGALETGWRRAHQLATKERIPIEDLRYMRNWYARHIYTSYPGFKKWVDAGQPFDESWHDKHAIQSWITWGANAGFEWINTNKTIELLNKHFNKDYKKINKKL